MGKKGGSKHLKRNPAPKFWPIHRKEKVWTKRPKPGPHSLKESIPLSIILRDILNYAKTSKEAKIIISQGKIIVDGKIRKEEAFVTGLMDVISIPEAKVNYRILPQEKGLSLHPIDDTEALFKLYRVEDKSIISPGKVQLNLHDGSNKLVLVEDTENLNKTVYQTLDVVKVNLKDRTIVEHLKPSKDATALIIKGKNRGIHGKILEIDKVVGKKRRLLITTIESTVGKKIQTILDYVFIIGDSKGSTISIHG